MGRDEQPTDEMDAGRGGRAAAGLADPPLISSGRRLGGRYLLERRLGHGGMAVVWLATDERLGRPVAVKVLSDTLTAERDYIGRFGREARVAAGLQHPNLVPVYDYDAGERPYLVMEYIEGGDLAARLERGEPPVAEQLAAELLSALRHIHAAGVLHRDIKPQNVLVDGHGHARLSDFGIARPRDATSLTRTGDVIGTERYLAPEVIGGEPASERSDLYALGVMLAEVARDGARAALWKLTDQLRDPDPARRPVSAVAALAELELGEARPPGEPTQPYAVDPEPQPAAARSPTGRAFDPTPTGIASSHRRSRAVALGAIALAAVAAVALLLLGGSDGGSDPDPVAGVDRGSAADPAQRGGGSGGAGEPGAPAPPADDPATTQSAPAADDGFALNEQGYALVGEGSYDEAVPVLERAVEALRGAGDEATYNYALYNLASAYLGAGRAEDAIPLLEERMAFDDGQLDEVEAKLAQAYAESGVKPPKPEKPDAAPLRSR